MKTYSITKETVDQVIEDLLRKFPKGQKGLLKKSDYREASCWRTSTDRYCMMVQPIPDGVDFGWDHDLVYRAYYWISENGGMRDYLRSKDPNAGYKAISRRVNRLDDRIPRSQSAWKKSSSPAIWNVRIGYSAELHVISTSQQSAEMLGKTVAAGAGLVGGGDRIWASKEAPADLQVLQHLRSRQVRRITKKIEANTERVNELKEQSAALLELCVSLQEFNSYEDGE